MGWGQNTGQSYISFQLLYDSRRERGRQTERDRERQRQTDRQTDTDTETERQRQADRQTDRQTDRNRERQTDRNKDRDRQRERERVLYTLSVVVMYALLSLSTYGRVSSQGRESIDQCLNNGRSRYSLWLCVHVRTS